MQFLDIQKENIIPEQIESCRFRGVNALYINPEMTYLLKYCQNIDICVLCDCADSLNMPIIATYLQNITKLTLMKSTFDDLDLSSLLNL